MSIMRVTGDWGKYLLWGAGLRRGERGRPPAHLHTEAPRSWVLCVRVFRYAYESGEISSNIDIQDCVRVFGGRNFSSKG